jgi:hypothetical protein
MKGFNLQKGAVLSEIDARKLIATGYNACVFNKSNVVIVKDEWAIPFIVQGSPAVVLGEVEVTLKNAAGKAVAWAICTHEDLT